MQQLNIKFQLTDSMNIKINADFISSLINNFQKLDNGPISEGTFLLPKIQSETSIMNGTTTEFSSLKLKYLHAALQWRETVERRIVEHVLQF